MTKKIALVGYGYWGPNLLRNLFEHPDCEMAYCCDKDGEKLKQVKKRYPTINLTLDYKTVLSDPRVDAVVLATPPATHFLFAKRAIEAGKDVLIEKPMTIKTSDAVKLESLANKHKKVVMIDHTFIFCEPVRMIKKIIESGEIGEILYIDSVRVNLGLFQKDSNVIYDLGIHDFSIIQYFLGLKPKSILAQASAHFGKQEDFANVYLEYPKNISAHIQVSWLSPVKIRRMIIVGIKKMILYDDIEPTEKIKIYDRGIEMPKNQKELEEMKIGYRSGDVWLPRVNVIEPLSVVVKEFLEALETRRITNSDVSFGKDIVELLEISTKAARSGKRIEIKNANK